MSAARGRSGGLSVGLLVLSLAIVVALLLVQGGGARGGQATPPTDRTQASAAPGPTGVRTTETAEESDAAHTPDSGLAMIAESDLPREAHETLDLIRAGGPFPHRQDDETFFNREGILPDRHRGYYREYTVLTPGSPDRGARRIVAGDDGDLFYTADHYDSFEQIEEGR